MGEPTVHQLVYTRTLQEFNTEIVQAENMPLIKIY